MENRARLSGGVCFDEAHHDSRAYHIMRFHFLLQQSETIIRGGIFNEIFRVIEGNGET